MKQLFYCSACGSLWYWNKDAQGKAFKAFYKSIHDATDDEVESSLDEPCGCTD